MAGHGGTQADMVPEKEPRVLCFDLQGTGSELRDTSSNDATAPNSTTPCDFWGPVTFKLPHITTVANRDSWLSQQGTAVDPLYSQRLS